MLSFHTLRKRSKQHLLESGAQDENLKAKQTEKQVITMLLFVTFVFLTLNIPVRSLVFYLNFLVEILPIIMQVLNYYLKLAKKQKKIWSFQCEHNNQFHPLKS